MSYQYDVFISYERTERGQLWVTKYFEPLLKEELSQELGRLASVFVDKRGIIPGDNWRRTLFDALASSRCLVPVLSGTYFSSEWCSREFAIMHFRSTKCFSNDASNRHKIIVPILVRDGDHLPPVAQAIQYAKFHNYYTQFKAFSESLEFRQFEQAVCEFAKSLASAINEAPANCDPIWREMDWIDVNIEQVLHYSITDVATVTTAQAVRLT